MKDLYTKHFMRLSCVKVILNEFKVQKEAILIKTKFTYPYRLSLNSMVSFYLITGSKLKSNSAMANKWSYSYLIEG